MKKTLNIVSLIACVLCLTVFLSACGGPAGKPVKNTHITTYYEDIPEEITESDETEEEEAETDLSFSDNTKAELAAKLEKMKRQFPKEMPLYAADESSFAYTLVFPQNSSNQLSAAVKTFRSDLQSGLDVDITAIEDMESGETKNELLVGKTNRTLSSTLLSRIKNNRKNCANDFFLYAKDGKIAIVADTDDALIRALDWFAQTFAQSDRTWTYLRDGYEFLYAPTYSLPEISVAGTTLFDFSVVTPRYGEYVYGRAVDDLVDTVYRNFHYSMEREEERFAKGKYEILIGNLSRTESLGITPSVNQYILRTVGNKLVIKGYDAICLYYGVCKLENMIADAVKTGKSLSLPSSYSFTGTVDPTKASTCQLTFHDEFSETTLADLWKKYDGGTSGDHSVLGGAIVNCGRSLCYVSDGILHMPTGRKAPDDKDFNESKITLKNDLWYRYGCLEVCAKMPLTPAHAAIWLNGLGEVDILENFSSETGFKSNIHKWYTENSWDGASNYAHTSLDGSAKYSEARKFSLDTEKYGGNLTDDFHVYSLDWTEDYFRFAVDGKTYFRYDYKDNEDEVDYFRQKLYLILVCGVGSNSYGAKYLAGRDDGKTYDFQIDYVRLYQNPSTDGLYNQ